VTVQSRILEGSLMHHRLEGAQHQFTYPVYFYRFDVDELENLGRKVSLFSYNRWNIVSINSGDYLERGADPLRQKVEKQLQRLHINKKPEKIELVTCARYFGYVFNPISFFYCYEGGEVFAVLAQVNNTFRESHLYALTEPVRLGGENGSRFQFRTQKEFHVSPFFDRKGDYVFTFSSAPENVHISVNLFKRDQLAIMTDWKGKAVKFNTANLVKILFKFPLSAFLTIPRIHWHALRLYFQKKQPVFSKPAALHPMTLRKADPTLKERVSRFAISFFLRKIRKGTLTIEGPGGEKEIFGGQQPGRAALIRLHDYRFYWRLAKDSGIGLGEGFMSGDWDSPDVTEVLQFLIENKSYLEKKPLFFKGFGDIYNRLAHLNRRNSLKNSKKNIQDHYDLGNDFFKLFLDSSMTYSCGIFQSEEDSLQLAQKQKISRMITKADIKRDQHILEIGSGWGAFAIEAVKQTGCRVTGITLSEEQLAFARERVVAEGLSDKIEFKLIDYRKMEGQFDRIVSIEMLEAVGHEYYGEFFRACARLLKPDGRAAIQVITIPHERYESYRLGCDFIQKHIFPGGHLPSKEILSLNALEHGKLQMAEVDDIGLHYARTLKMWREAFIVKIQDIEALKFPQSVIKAWIYYFHYCESGFATGYLQNLQFVLKRKS